MATYEKYVKDGEVPAASSPTIHPSASLSSTTHDDDEKATISKSRKKRLQDTRRLANRIKALLDEGRVEEDVKGVQIVKVFKTSTKQAMIARVRDSTLWFSLKLNSRLVASTCPRFTS